MNTPQIPDPAPTIEQTCLLILDQLTMLNERMDELERKIDLLATKYATSAEDRIKAGWWRNAGV